MRLCTSVRERELRSRWWADREGERETKRGREREISGSASPRAGNRGWADRRVGEHASQRGKERREAGAGLVLRCSQSEAGVLLCRVNLTLATQ